MPGKDKDGKGSTPLEQQNPRIMKTETRHLMTPLTEDETRQYSNDLAKTIQDKHTEEMRQSSIKSELRRQIQAFEEKISSLANTVANKAMLKPVECETILEGVKIREVRTDTGEIILNRPATDSELQTKLHIVE